MIRIFIPDNTKNVNNNKVKYKFYYRLFSLYNNFYQSYIHLN